MRPDTNTCGHMQWFFFTIQNKSKEKIKINICNNRKAKTLYERVIIILFREWNHMLCQNMIKNIKDQDGIKLDKI